MIQDDGTVLDDGVAFVDGTEYFGWRLRSVGLALAFQNRANLLSACLAILALEEKRTHALILRSVPDIIQTLRLRIAGYLVAVQPLAGATRINREVLENRSQLEGTVAFEALALAAPPCVAQGDRVDQYAVD